MTTSIENIVNGFPYPIIEPISSHPKYDAISNLHQKLNDNATSVHTPLGGGSHGRLTLVVTPTLCNTLSNTPFLAPVDPGVNPGLPANPTGAKISNTRHTYEKDTNILTRYNNTFKALKRQLIGSINDFY